MEEFVRESLYIGINTVSGMTTAVDHADWQFITAV